MDIPQSERVDIARSVRMELDVAMCQRVAHVLDEFAK
jgi:hypothetical protein